MTTAKADPITTLCPAPLTKVGKVVGLTIVALAGLVELAGFIEAGALGADMGWLMTVVVVLGTVMKGG
jgi:hypothetical protein